MSQFEILILNKLISNSNNHQISWLFYFALLSKSDAEETIDKGILEDFSSFEIVKKLNSTLIKKCCFTPPEFSQHEITSALPNKDATFHHNIGITQKFEEEKELTAKFDKKQDHMNKCFFSQSAHGIILSKNSENEAPRMGSGFLIGH